MNLLKLNIWRKFILAGFALGVFIMFAFDWGYNYHIGHVVRLGVAAGCFWLAVDRL